MKKRLCFEVEKKKIYKKKSPVNGQITEQNQLYKMERLSTLHLLLTGYTPGLHTLKVGSLQAGK